MDDTLMQPPYHLAIPAVFTNLVGRKREIPEVLQILYSTRLVSLVGPGGCGKTRLAHAVALEIEHQFAQGVCWVEFAQVHDPALVLHVVAKALTIVEQPDVSLEETLLEKLAAKQMLLVLDNGEHLLAACAHLVETLLRSTTVKVMVTSREPLGVAGERLYPVPPLTLPTPHQSFAEVEQCDAVQLFVERARSMRAEFTLKLENANAVATICRQLDGLPLAIELASARVNLLSVEQIQQRLDHRLDLLTTATRVDQRHRTLRTVMDWSYDLLAPAERLLLQRLAVFVAGFTLNTVESACGWGELTPPQILELLDSLVNKSLVVVETIQAHEARYRLLETIRQYANEKLLASGASAETHDHYLDCFLHFAEEITPKLTLQYQQLWMNWLASEYANLRVALTWAHESQRCATGLRLAIALYQFWDARGYVREGFTWFERLYRRADETAAAIPFAVRVNALTLSAFLAMFLKEIPAATTWGQQAVTLCEAAGEAGKPLLGFVLAGASSAAQSAGDWQTALTLLARSIEADRASGDPSSRAVGMGLYVSGSIETAVGHYELAHSHLNQAWELAQQADDRYRMALILSAMGDLARCQQRFTQALFFYEKSLALFHEAGASRDVPNTQRNFAYACLRQGDTRRAQALFRQSLEEQQTRNHRTGLLRGLLGFAALAAAAGFNEASVCLHGFVFGTRKDVMVGINAGDKADQLDYEHYATRLRTQWPDAEFEAAQAKGRFFTLAQAIAFALTLSLTDSTPATADTPTHDLTQREHDVAVLIGCGLANGEIADQLVLSKRTVEKHVANIFAKLGLTNRAQIVRWAVDHGLTGKATAAGDRP